MRLIFRVGAKISCRVITELGRPAIKTQILEQLSSSFDWLFLRVADFAGADLKRALNRLLQDNYERELMRSRVILNDAMSVQGS